MGREQMLPSFLELRKLSRQGMPEKKEYRLALMGNVSTQHMADAIRGYGAYEQLRLNVFDADYDQIEEQLRNSHSEAYQFHPDAFFLFLSSERLYEDFTNGSAGANFADDLFDKISGWWDRIEQLSGGIVLQNTIMEADDGVYGSYGSRLEQSFIYQTRKLNYLIMCGAEKRKEAQLAAHPELAVESSDPGIKELETETAGAVEQAQAETSSKEVLIERGKPDDKSKA